MTRLFAHKVHRVIGGIACALVLASCVSRPPALERVHARGELVVLTRNSPTTYYQSVGGATGLEYDLARRFADYLGVRLKMLPVEDFDDLLPMIERGEADLAAAGLTITKARKRRVLFGPAYQDIVPQLVYNADAVPPPTFADLAQHTLEVIAGSSHVESLQGFTKFFPDLSWTETGDYTSEELLQRVAHRDIDYTVADSNELSLGQRVYPGLRVAFSLSTAQHLGWAFQKGRDRSLYNAAVAFFSALRRDNTLTALLEHYYGRRDTASAVGTRTYLAHIRTRLPGLRPLFQQAARETRLDWRLLAAIGYQESKWDPDAVSPTGVRGVMMLTENTASSLGVQDRADPRSSILGGARYFRQVLDTLPAHIEGPARTAMALAAYNLGPGHLEDARQLTEKNGGNPDVWIDVRRSLPLLSQHKWFTQTRLGYARGYEALALVDNVHGYYDILSRLSDQPRPVQSPEEPGTDARQKPEAARSALRLSAASERMP